MGDVGAAFSAVGALGCINMNCQAACTPGGGSDSGAGEGAARGDSGNTGGGDSGNAEDSGSAPDSAGVESGATSD
jgi:hypothetical protein